MKSINDMDTPEDLDEQGWEDFYHEWDGGARWKESPHEVLKVVDEQLKEFGLEIITTDIFDPDPIWKIEKISKQENI
jgi:hypothetical protein